MRLASVRLLGGDDGWRLAAIDDGGATLLPAALGTLDDVIRGGPDALEAVRAALDGAPAVALEELHVGPPLRRFNRDILCTGWNYLDHFYESRGKREGQDPAAAPKHPTFFTKGPDTVVGPTDEIAFDDSLSEQWDYEAEVALVIGRDGRSIAEEDALEHVFGYCAANDVSQRDLQRAHGGQWLKGKSLDRTMPLGPWITTADAVADPHDLRIQCELNGRVLQDASTSEVAFSFARLIAELSRGMTLRAGDVVLTGTPSGIGNAREPKIFLQAGDLLVTRVLGLGELSNRVARVALA